MLSFKNKTVSALQWRFPLHYIKPAKRRKKRRNSITILLNTLLHSIENIAFSFKIFVIWLNDFSVVLKHKTLVISMFSINSIFILQLEVHRWYKADFCPRVNCLFSNILNIRKTFVTVKIQNKWLTSVLNFFWNRAIAFEH